MTKLQEEGKCPICGKQLQCVAKHIRVIHGVKNTKERAILNKLSTGRILLGGGTCPLLVCGKSVLHIEKHLRAHTDVTQQLANKKINSLKRTLAVKQLADLRATNPRPPMVSQLDLGDQEDPQPGPAPCNNPACIAQAQLVNFQKQELQELRHDLALLVSESRIHINKKLYSHSLQCN